MRLTNFIKGLLISSSVAAWNNLISVRNRRLLYERKKVEAWAKPRKNSIDIAETVEAVKNMKPHCRLKTCNVLAETGCERCSSNLQWFFVVESFRMAFDFSFATYYYLYILFSHYCIIFRRCLLLSRLLGVMSPYTWTCSLGRGEDELCRKFCSHRKLDFSDFNLFSILYAFMKYRTTYAFPAYAWREGSFERRGCASPALSRNFRRSRFSAAYPEILQF